MKNRGRIIVLFIVLFSSYLFGSVKAVVDHRSVMLGDSVTFRIVASGEDVKVPQLDSLCGVDIISESTQQSIQIINGDMKKSISHIYVFEPEKSCDIKSIPIEVAGKIEQTKPIHIEVSNTPQQTTNADFLLELHVNKKEVFIGESFAVTLVFKQKRGVDALDSKFFPPKLDGFWIKSQSQPEKTQQGDYIVTTIHYKMAAQREGELIISPAKIKIALRMMRRDFWNNFAPNVKWRTYYSNSIKMKVYAPPKGVKLVGNLDISFKVDKTKVHPNEAVNGVITIKGDGNIEDIESFRPYIQNANVFDEKPEIDQENGVFKEKIAFVADENFTIPSFSIRYFDPKTKKIITKKTDPVSITVIGGVTKEKKLVVKKASTQEAPAVVRVGTDTSAAITWVILSFIAGIFTGGVAVFMKFNPSRTKQQKKRFSMSDKKVLFVRLLPYKDHQDVKEVLDVLENNLYGDNTKTIERSKIKEIVEKYDIS